MKKITAIISPEYPPKTNWGGLATFNANLAQLLTNICDEVHVITFDGNGFKSSKITDNGLTIHYIKLKTEIKLINFLYFTFPFGPIRNTIKKIAPFLMFALEWNIFSLFYFIKLKRRKNINTIHTSTYYAPGLLINFFFPKITTIIHLQGHSELLTYDHEKTFDSKILSKIENFYTNRFSKKIICCSKDIKRRYLTSNPNVRKKTIYIPNFITKNFIEKTKNTNKNNLIFYGRLEYRKGVDILLHSFISIAKANPLVKLFLIGEKYGRFLVSKKLINFDNFFESLNIGDNIKNRIIVLPKIDSHTSLMEILKIINGIVVVPSRYEPFGFAIIEPMAIGLPVIASSSGGGSEIIENEKNGFLTLPNSASLANAISQVLNMTPAKLKNISIIAQKRVLSQYSAETALTKYKKLYSVL